MKSKVNKIFIVVFSLMLCFSNTIFSQASSKTESVEYQYLMLINSLTGQDFINAGNSLSTLDNIENYSEEELNLYIMNFIVENHESDAFSINGATQPPVTYGSLNPAETALASANPYQASQYYISSQVAINYTQQKFGYSGYQDSSDAFRHACWNAVLTLRIGSSAAKNWTDAHETTSSGIDKQMDLFNNDLGRRLASDVDGAGYPEYNTLPLVEKVYNGVKLGMGRIIKNGQLYTSAF